MNIAIVGVGSITAKYLAVLQHNQTIKVKYICDVIETDLVRTYKHAYRYTNDYKEIPLKEIDAVFILTPPATHLDIAKYFIENHVQIFIEKPLVSNYDELKFFRTLSIKSQSKIYIIFHWSFGSEIAYLKDKQTIFDDFDSIEISIQDPYYDGTIMPKKRQLGGAWLDSGINALSFLSNFIDIKKLHLTRKISKVDENTGLDYMQERCYHYDHANISIKINWTADTDQKMTIIKKKNQTITINHSAQCIYLNSEKVYEDHRYPRLFTHYNNFFNSLDRLSSNLDTAVLIHNILFE